MANRPADERRAIASLVDFLGRLQGFWPKQRYGVSTHRLNSGGRVHLAVETLGLHLSERLILLVEDNPDDEVLVKRTFERAGLNHRLFTVHGGQEAMAYLAGQPPFNDREKFPIPDLVLLDIKLPGSDGFEVLRSIRQNWMPWHLPVVMLTASDEIRDANQAYKLGANSFLVKPLDFENAQELARSLDKVLESLHH